MPNIETDVLDHEAAGTEPCLASPYSDPGFKGSG